MKGGYREGSGRKKGYAAFEAEKTREIISERLSIKLEPIITKAIKQAITGDKHARAWLFERAYGKPKEIVDMSIVDSSPIFTNLQVQQIAKRVIENDGT